VEQFFIVLLFGYSDRVNGLCLVIQRVSKLLKKGGRPKMHNWPLIFIFLIGLGNIVDFVRLHLEDKVILQDQWNVRN
jgi:hypothetical protein